MIELDAGETAIDFNVGVTDVTVSAANAETLPDEAVIVADPAATPVASPPLVIVAAAVLLELHVTLLKALVDPSLYVPVAENCCVLPAAIDTDAGVMVIDCKLGALTEIAADPVIPLATAETVALPADTPVAIPDADIVATERALDDHEAVLVRDFVDPSL